MKTGPRSLKGIIYGDWVITTKQVTLNEVTTYHDGVLKFRIGDEWERGLKRGNVTRKQPVILYKI